MEGNATPEACDRVGVNPRFVSMNVFDDEKSGWHKFQWRTAVPPLVAPQTGLTPADYFGRRMVDFLPEEVRVGVVALPSMAAPASTCLTSASIAITSRNSPIG